MLACCLLHCIELCEGSPWNQIAARGDLSPSQPVCMGAYDAKVINSTTFHTLSILAQVRWPRPVTIENQTILLT